MGGKMGVFFHYYKVETTASFPCDLSLELNPISPSRTPLKCCLSDACT